MNAIIIGNGFTSNIISTYKDEPMMKEFYLTNRKVIDKAEELFHKFRDITLMNEDIYIVTEALYPSDDWFPSEACFPSDNDIVPKHNIRDSIIDQMNAMGFKESESLFDEYFVKYGLMYSINKPKIIGIESYLKVIHLFSKIDIFDTDVYERFKLNSNVTYYNNGNHGIDSIDNKNIDSKKLISTLSSFSDVYTTNYDTILDDVLSDAKRYPYHLHGSFSINHLNKDPDGRYGPEEAKLIWGINAESKFESLSPGLDFNSFDFNNVRFDKSRLADYYDFIEFNEYSDVFILGYSGENDDHINSRIRKNKHIKNLVVFVNPNSIEHKETLVRAKKLYESSSYSIELRSWDEFWDAVTF